MSDSQSTRNISENPAQYRQAKHIDVRYYAIRHSIHAFKVYIPPEHRPAVLFTKALQPQSINGCVSRLQNGYEAIEEGLKERKDIEVRKIFYRYHCTSEMNAYGYVTLSELTKKPGEYRTE